MRIEDKDFQARRARCGHAQNAASSLFCLHRFPSSPFKRAALPVAFQSAHDSIITSEEDMGSRGRVQPSPYISCDGLLLSWKRQFRNAATFCLSNLVLLSFAGSLFSPVFHPLHERLLSSLDLKTGTNHYLDLFSHPI